ncbi:hypothetical protein MRB53_037968 [Persea americana]|nr:hypothetical protein MRB53_037968 [Persea americana]
MRVACLQINPIIGEVETNLHKADNILAQNHDGLRSTDLLVLPELAFTGYTFLDLNLIKPYLEPTTSGVSTKWAISTALRYNCHVIVGYPEISTEQNDSGEYINYNSTVTINPQGKIVATYRKSFLYYTDEIWASEGSGFFCGEVGSLGIMAHGICMDINPYQFTAPWTDYEFATYSLKGNAKLIVLSTAWLTHTPREELLEAPAEPDGQTLIYWMERFKPLSSALDQTFIVVFANRIGTEANRAGTFRAKNGQEFEQEPFGNFAGSSCVMRFKDGRVEVIDYLGQAEEKLLLVDTSDVSYTSSLTA